jgi:SAM-dependent methyltransferase
MLKPTLESKKRYIWLEPYMILMNDTRRNQFYDQVLKGVTGKRCLEIGLGAGLLSFIALKYQPKHIVAVELQPHTYELGKYLIKKLGVEDKITLLHEKVDSSFIKTAEFDVVYHEVVGAGLWNEDIFLHLNTSVSFIPSTYVCDFYACEISLDDFPDIENARVTVPDDGKFKNYYNNIRDPSWPDVNELDDFDLLPDRIKTECTEQFGFMKKDFISKHTQEKFTPGVDFDIDYVSEIQNILTLENSRGHAEIINKSFVGEEKYLSCSKKVLSMEINQNSKKILLTDHNGITTITNIDFTKNFIDLTIDRAALPGTSLIIPVFSMKHGESELLLSQGHWGHCGNNAIVKSGTNNITVRQHFNAHGIEYF